jgi:hypothetical protein
MQIVPCGFEWAVPQLTRLQVEQPDDVHHEWAVPQLTHGDCKSSSPMMSITSGRCLNSPTAIASRAVR